MGLNDNISENQKEIAGSRSKNRLTIQISYAIQLIMDFYSIDFLVMMDYIEDVSIICNPYELSKIHLFQVKTKSSDKQYHLSAIIHDNWYQKLYSNAQKYIDYLESASVVCNTDVIDRKCEVFPNAKTNLTEKAITENVNKIKAAIAVYQNITEEDVDLSKFYFVRSTLSTKGHKEETEHKFQEFLLNQEPDLQVAVAKSIYKVLYDELDQKFNNEINEDCTDISEIFSQKGVDGQYIKDIIACGLAVQLPTLEKLFDNFGITAVSEKRKYVSSYSKIKMDMFSGIKLFIDFKKKLICLIDETNQNGIESMPDILSAVYTSMITNKAIPKVYHEEYYLKLLIMILIHRYCYGGEI